MKKLILSIPFFLFVPAISLTGCGGSESQVVEAPPEDEDIFAEPAGISQEEYDKAMAEGMNSN